MLVESRGNVSVVNLTITMHCDCVPCFRLETLAIPPVLDTEVSTQQVTKGDELSCPEI